MQTINSANAILEIIRRNSKCRDVARKNGCEYMVHQYDHAIHELALAYSIGESEDDNNPLSVAEVLELAQQKQDLFPI